jgi:hypothetical protein
MELSIEGRQICSCCSSEEFSGDLSEGGKRKQEEGLLGF